VTFATTFHDYQAATPAPPFPAGCSPNLMLVLLELQRRWPWMSNDGCYGKRPIRGSTSVPSTHSYGAAIDVSYPPANDDVIASQVVGFLVGRSEELGLDAVHDYRRCRIWRAGRTASTADACSLWWKAQRPDPVTGMGQTWANHLHLETAPSRWSDSTPIATRWVE
jgi:hypothetical protein